MVISIDSENSILILFILFYPLRVLAINNTNKESLDMSTRSIAKIVTANEQAEGAGARVRRSIGIMNQRNFDPFLMFDHFSSAGTNGFPEHPHRGQETITFIMVLWLMKIFITGSKGILYAGDLQFMTAGKGVVHSEMPVANADGSPTVGLQLWVDLPNNESSQTKIEIGSWKTQKLLQMTVKLPSRSYLVGHGVESVKELAYTPINYYYYKVKAGGEFKQELQPGFNYFVC